jgi:hypothetical protein
MYVLTQQPKGQLYYEREERWNKASTYARTWTHQDNLDDDDNNNNNRNTKSYLARTNNI